MVGAKASQHFSMCSDCQATQQIIAVLRVAHTTSAPHHACACCPHIHAYLLPSSSHGPHSRSPSHVSAVQHVTTCRACGSGALRRPAFSFLDCSVPSWRPFCPGRLEPTLVSSNPPPPFAPVSLGLLLCGSLSYSLPPNLSCSPLLFLSCCTSLFPSQCALPSLSLCFSLPLSRAQKGGSGCSVHLYPPRGSNHPPRDRRGVVYPLSYDDGVSAPWHHALHSSSPLCIPLSCVSSFAWGCVQQRRGGWAGPAGQTRPVQSALTCPAATVGTNQGLPSAACTPGSGWGAQ